MSSQQTPPLPQLYEPISRPRSVIAQSKSTFQVPTSITARNTIVEWRDFDHSRTIALGIARSTLLCYNKANKRYILRCCTLQEWTKERSELAELARFGNLFILTQCIFVHNKRVYVGSEKMDMSLADIIDGTISMNESQVCAVLSKLIESLCSLEDRSTNLRYSNVQASNVYIQRDGTVKLESFGPKVRPERITEGAENTSCQEIYHIAIHMITRSPEMPGQNVPQQKLVSMKTGECNLDIQFETTPPFLDFLQLCKQAKDVRRLFNHPFLKDADVSCLRHLVDNAEYSAMRHCYPFNEDVWNNSQSNT